MPDDQNQNPTPEGKTPDSSAETKNTVKEGSKPEEHMIPKSRFDEVNNKYKDIQKQLDALTAEKTQKDTELAEKERKAKEEQGKFEELYKGANDELDRYKAESKTTKTRIQQLEAVINGLLEVKLEAVPENFRDLIPAHLTPEQKLEWLSAAEKKGLFGTVSQKKDVPVGSQTNPAGGATTDLNQMSPGQLLRMAYGQK